MRRFMPVARFGLLFFGFSTVVIGLHWLLGDAINGLVESLAAQLSDSIAIALAIVLALSADVLLPVPSSVLSIWAVVSQGPVVGFMIVWLGMNLACLLGYLLGAGASEALVGRFIRAKDLAQARKLSDRFGMVALVFARAVPVLAEASVVSAGLSGMPFRRFAWVCSLSNAGIAIAYAAAGAWANTTASFALAFAASISLPALAFAAYRLLSTEKKRTMRQRARTENTLLPSFNLNFSYPVCFTRDVFAPSNPTLIQQLQREAVDPTAIKVQFFVDAGLLKGNNSLRANIERYCHHHGLNWLGGPVALPGGDQAKNQAEIERLYDIMLEAGMDRQSYVVAIGGGGVLDAAGYAASTFHRGIRLIRMPTTVLAQNDAGVGVKNGINSRGLKNLLGCFAIPYAIINDAAFLESLSQRDFRSGFAEAVKVSLIRDAAFFDWICANAAALNAREEKATAYLIQRCAELHLNQICNGGDPFEQGSARPLDYGHWSAHKLEQLTDHALAHGEAVAIGMVLDAFYAVEIGLLQAERAVGIAELLRSLGFAVWHPALLQENNDGESVLLLALEEFRQHLGGNLCITLLRDIGLTLEADTMDTQALLRARDALQRFAT